MCVCGSAFAQPMLYAQHLPEGTVYIRSGQRASPHPPRSTTDFAGDVALGEQPVPAGSRRISSAGEAGGKTVELKGYGGRVRPATASIHPKSGTFITVVLHDSGNAVVPAIITDKPEYNQLKARLTFYNASADCNSGSLVTGGRPVFSSVPANRAEARSLNPVSATVIAACGQDKAKPLDLGRLEEGGLYSVWMMRLDGQLTAFLAHDTIEPPRG